MPIDPMMTDALLGTFRNMLQECRDKNLSGEHFDNMSKHVARLEELAQTNDDMNAFNGTVMQEDLYIKISDCYSRLLSNQAMTNQEEKGYDDSTLLKQSVDALRDAIKRLIESKENALQENKNYDPKEAYRKAMKFAERNESKNGMLSKEDAKKYGGGYQQMTAEGEKNIDETLKKTPNAFDSSAEIEVLMKNELLIKPIEALIALGEEPGMTLPRFLRLQIEKGMDKAMEGSVAVREGLVFSYNSYKAMAASPHHNERERQFLESFDSIAAKSAFGVPNSEELKYERMRIEYHYEPLIIEWDEIKNRWESLIYDLYLWSLSYCPIAPKIFPWNLSHNPKEAVIDTQKTTPGIFKQKERLFNKYFGLTFHDVFKHPTFKWEVDNYLMGDSQEIVEFLIEKVYSTCIPLQDMPLELIPMRAELYKEQRERNPETDKYIQRYIQFYDETFGEGRYASKYGNPEKITSNAKPWDWSSFKNGN